MATQADIDAIDRAIATGERKVRFADGREVEYRAISDLIAARGLLSVNISSVPMMRTTLTTFARD
jgi:hypothetical protein